MLDNARLTRRALSENEQSEHEKSHCVYRSRTRLLLRLVFNNVINSMITFYILFIKGITHYVEKFIERRRFNERICIVLLEELYKCYEPNQE